MILVTGSNGFLGSCLVSSHPELNLRLISRNKNKHPSYDFFNQSIDSKSDYSKALEGVDVIVHCAARVHVMKDSSEKALEEYREVNTFGTLNLAKQAAAKRVKRFIFISSVKVNGESTSGKGPFTEADERSPRDFYGQSKSEAEELLLQLSSKTGLEVVIIRPPLIYGPGVKANFASLMNLVSKGYPLPFSAISNNKRSLVSIVNLVDLIVTCVEHPKAANQVFLVSDDHDLSTSDMIERMSTALKIKCFQFPVPVWLYQIIGKFLGKSEVVERLVGSLSVDISHTKKTLDWAPPQSIEQGFELAAKGFSRK